MTEIKMLTRVVKLKQQHVDKLMEEIAHLKTTIDGLRLELEETTTRMNMSRTQVKHVAEEISNICDMLENYLAQYDAYAGPIEAVSALRVLVRKLD